MEIAIYLDDLMEDMRKRILEASGETKEALGRYPVTVLEFDTDV